MGITRFSRSLACPICGGWPELLRGEGRRCTGYLHADGQVAFCSREEHAGGLDLDPTADPPAFAHRLHGDCRCGAVHGDPLPAPVTSNGNGRAKRAEGQGTIVASYPYHDADGSLLFEVVRFAPKDFRQRRPDPARPGKWTWSVRGVTRVPYRLPELLQSVGLVFVVEGEKDADRLRSLGAAATTAAGGAGKWTAPMVERLRDRSVVVLYDEDPPETTGPRKGRRAGKDGADALAQLLRQAGIVHRVVPLPVEPDSHQDISDYLDAGHTLDELMELVLGAPAWEPPGEAPVPPRTPWDPGDGEVEFSDLRNARRLVAAHGERMRYDHTRGQWRLWNGRVWEHDEMEGSMRLAKSIIPLLYEEMFLDAERRQLEGAARRERRKVVLACESTGRLRAMLDNARSDVAATQATWDQEPWWFNCSNGTIDLRTGDLLDHRPERWQSKIAPVAYDPAAECPRWERFLSRIFSGDDELIRFVQKAVGLSMVGAVIEHVLFVLWGSGANGKSTFLNCVLEMFGDYGRAASPDLLLHRDLPSHSTNIAELRGVRLVSTVEGTGRLNETLVKSLTGGDVRNARFLFQDSFTYIPSDTFWMATNHKPTVSQNSEGIWRRIQLIPFDVSIPPEEQEHDLGTTLRAEYPGILRWAVEGCRAWQEEGLGAPAAVRNATADYRQEMDTLRSFLEEATVPDKWAKVASADLFKNYQGWAEATGERPLSQRTLGLRLREAGLERVRDGHDNRWCWQGIRMRGSEEAVQIPLIGHAATERSGPEPPCEPDPNDYATSEEYLAAARDYFEQQDLATTYPQGGDAHGDDDA